MNLAVPAPSALNVLVDITQSDPTATPTGVTYALDYGVAVSGEQADFDFLSATPNMLIVRRVTVPFATGVMSRTLTITAAEDVDGLSEVLSIAVQDGTGYAVTDTTTEATRTLTLTDNEPAVILDELSSVSMLAEGGAGSIFIRISAPGC